MAKDYNSINFKNKDIDKFATKFGQGDPVKSVVEQARDNMNTIAKTPAQKPKGNFEFRLEDEGGHGPIGSVTYITDTTGLGAGKKSFDLRYGSGVPKAGVKVGEMSAETVKRLVKNQGKKKK